MKKCGGEKRLVILSAGLYTLPLHNILVSGGEFFHHRADTGKSWTPTLRSQKLIKMTEGENKVEERLDEEAYPPGLVCLLELRSP